MARRLYYFLAYAASWAVFGAVGLALNAGCAVLLIFPRRPGRAAAVRRVIRALFAAWVKWLHATRLIAVVWHGPELGALPAPAVYIANHPSLLDATFLLARLPDTLCIFKPKLGRNPFLAPAALMAGYVSGDAGVDLIRELAPQVAAGRTVLLFPEGTRTDSNALLNPFKPGFAFIARRAGAPIQILAIRASHDLCPRGSSWWRLPRFPTRVDIHVDRMIMPDPGRSAEETVAISRRQMLARLESLA